MGKTSSQFCGVAGGLAESADTSASTKKRLDSVSRVQWHVPPQFLHQLFVAIFVAISVAISVAIFLAWFGLGGATTRKLLQKSLLKLTGKLLISGRVFFPLKFPRVFPGQSLAANRCEICCKRWCERCCKNLLNVL